MKTVRTFSNLAEAGFCSSLLEASGIRAFVADEQSYASGYGAAIGPLRLQVGEDDFERAVAVLERGPDAASENAAAKSADFSAQRGLGDRSVPWAIFAVPIAAVLVLFFVVNQVEEKRRTTAFQRGAEQTVTRDANGDGRPDETYFYRDGRLVRSETDRNFDGRPDAWIRYGPNEVPEESSQDRNPDGRPDAWFVYENRGGGSGREDLDFNGIPDTATVFKDGFIAQRDIRPNETGSVIRREIYEHGELREEPFDEDRDGKFDVKIRFDVFGNRAKPMPVDPVK